MLWMTACECSCLCCSSLTCLILGGSNHIRAWSVCWGQFRQLALQKLRVVAKSDPAVTEVYMMSQPILTETYFAISQCQCVEGVMTKLVQWYVQYTDRAYDAKQFCLSGWKSVDMADITGNLTGFELYMCLTTGTVHQTKVYIQTCMAFEFAPKSPHMTTRPSDD